MRRRGFVLRAVQAVSQTQTRAIAINAARTSLKTLLFVAVALAAPLPVGEALAAAPPQIQASSGILIDASDGRVLLGRNSTERRAIASTTKIVTALVVIDRAKPTDRVKVSAAAEAVGASDSLVAELELVQGEDPTVEELLYAMMMFSANDAALALAEHVSGSENAFAKLMNQRARAAGAVASNFVNPHGLDDPQHYSTASDLSKIARDAMRDEEFRKIVATYERDIKVGERVVKVRNRNDLLVTYEGADGVKTGRTKIAGRSLVASATRAGESRIVVILNSPDPEPEATTMLNYGFDGFKRIHGARKGAVWGQATVGDGQTRQIVASADLSLLVEVGQPPPTPVFSAQTGRIEMKGVGSVAAKYRCPVGGCETNTSDALAPVMTLLSPLLRLGHIFE